jgi:1-acyl-sn-glycerol-3-phosphate acyltransferase
MAERPLVWKSLQALARVLTTLLYDLKVEGLENIPAQGGALIVSNHQSYLDPVLLGSRTRRPLNYIAKSELFEIHPALSWLFSSLGGFPIRQGARDVGAVRESIQRLHQGHLLTIYPEGSRTADGEIARMERGVALIDRRAHVPVIPAVIVGAFEAWPSTRTLPCPGRIRVRFGPPMNLAGLNSDELIATIDRTLRKMYEDLRAEYKMNGHLPRHSGNHNHDPSSSTIRG